DIEKAFDRLWIPGLLLKCIKFKLPVWMQIFITDFLHNRKFTVKLNRAESTEKIPRAGVPQGSSVLGPVLFNIYMADLRPPSHTKLALYADDAAFIVQHINPKRLAPKMAKAIPDIESWYDKWRLQINIEKTKALFLSRTNQDPPPNKIKLYNKEITWSPTEKYLGITLDKTLHFKNHLDNKLQTVKAACGALNPIIGKKSKVSIK
ncbi:hypothetical protein JGG70_24610, partial [Salmonella enterica subsp. enterica serovar Typhimurium]|nr:hypothetical protein [Salmonella enterica subsp. enterica serovar Typhimurium]